MSAGSCTYCKGRGHTDMLGLEDGRRALIRVPCGICGASGMLPLGGPEAYRNIALTPLTPGARTVPFPVDRIAGAPPQPVLTPRRRGFWR